MARTDRSFVCLACRHRFWPVLRCPVCQESSWLVDLELDPEGAMRPGPVPGKAPRILMGLGVSGGVLAAAAVVTGIVSLGVAEAILAPSILALGAGAAARAPTPPRTWSILAGPVARARAERTTLAGTVRSAKNVKLLRSPLANVVCVAYRITGHAGQMPVDDARGRPFDLELESGELVRVEADVATIDLPIDPEGDRAIVPSSRAAFLKHRGVTDREALRAVEATLSVGARVVVVGSLHEDTIASGYRDTRTQRTLFDAPGAPLLIRPAPEIQGANPIWPDASA